MNFDDVLISRRSIRKYLNYSVPDSLITEIIEAGIFAPSAHNRQPWKIRVLVGSEKDEIANLLLLKAKIDSSVSRTADVILNVPVLLIVFYDGDSIFRDNDMLSIGAFIENMCLKATSLGLGSLWIANTNHIKEEISSYLNIELECVSCVGIGYKNQDPNMRPRKSYEEIVIE